MTVLDFLSGGLCKVVQEDRAKRKSRESAPTLSLAQQLRSKNARGGGGDVPDRSELASQKRKNQFSKDETSFH